MQFPSFYYDFKDICRTNGTVYCQISQLHPPESLTDPGRVDSKPRPMVSNNHSEPASSALVRLKAEPRTPDQDFYKSKRGQGGQTGQRGQGGKML